MLYTIDIFSEPFETAKLNAENTSSNNDIANNENKNIHKIDNLKRVLIDLVHCLCNMKTVSFMETIKPILHIINTNYLILSNIVFLFLKYFLTFINTFLHILPNRD